MKSSTFCSVPWTQVATNASGKYRVCCNALPGKNLVLDSNGQPMAVKTHSVAEAWNSPTYQKLRREFLKGEKPEMCQRCFREEDAGVKSARLGNNERWQSPHQDKADPPIDVQYIDLRLGNLCNLRCRMCNPYASSQWVDEWNAVASQAELVPSFALNPEEASRLKRLDWPDSPETWKNLSSVLETVEEIYLTGGEPFLSLRQTDLLKELISSGKAAKIRLKYNTNLTCLPEKLIELWPHFSRVTLNVSIDGIGPLDEYIRHPTKWPVVEGHLKQLFSLQDQGLPLSLGVHTTVQMYNILQLHEVLEYFESEFGLFPYLNILNHPHCLNVRTLPVALKGLAEKRLNPWKNKKEISEVISYMRQESWEEKYFREFIDYTSTLDRLRGQSFGDLQGEFTSHFLEAN